MPDVIEVAGLAKSYGKRRGIVDVDFSVREGEVFGFLGPNGAGKTTTIRCFLGFIRPDAGRATILGLDAWADAPRLHRRLAYLSGDPRYWGELTAERFFDFVGDLRGLPRGAWRPLAERLGADASVPIKKLSHGNRQKVGLVQVFMGDEPVLVMDEPTTGLDPLMQREFLSLVEEARSAGRTVFLSSHNLGEAERACDRVAIIREGRIVAVESVEALPSRHLHSVDVVLAEPPADDVFVLPDVEVVEARGREVRLLVRGDLNGVLARLATLDVSGMAVSTPDLEDVFMTYYETAPEELVPDEPTPRKPTPGQPTPGGPMPGQPTPTPPEEAAP
jgi:ABC-2 type transport system ATP-binding protein